MNPVLASKSIHENGVLTSDKLESIMSKSGHNLGYL
jgi:hypothetical protein